MAELSGRRPVALLPRLERGRLSPVALSALTLAVALGFGLVVVHFGWFVKPLRTFRA
jgi:hypothetical protein